MTDSMNFGPEWLRNLSSDGSTGGGTGGIRYQLAEYRYGREDMLALFDKTLRPPNSLCSFTTLYSEQPLLPLAFQTSAEDERAWQSRATPVGVSRGRGGSLERGGRGSRGRGSYQPYGRSGGFESGGGWGNSEQSDWSPRKDYNTRSSSVDNWRRSRGDEEEGWRSNSTRISEKWGRQTSWRDGDSNDDRGAQDRNRNWHDGPRSNMQRRIWDEDNLPEWANENLGEGGGTFDASGAFHGSDDELVENKASEPEKKESPLQKSASQHSIQVKKHPTTLPSSKSSVSLSKPMEEKKKELENPHVNNEKEPPESMKSEIKQKKENKLSDPEREETLIKDKSDIIILNESNGISSDISINNRVDEDFDRLQEDLVLKIVEEPSKSPHVNNSSQIEVGMSTQPPPNLAPPVQDKWYYQDPQGDLQGPFSSSEMAEWFRAGYFTISLLVRRQCDERFYMLGDLITLCNGNPFQTSLRIAPLKNETPNDLLKMQIMQQLALRQASSRVYPQGEPWTGMPPLPQRDVITQQLIPQPQQMPPPDLPYLQSQNPLLQMFQMNQANKNIPEKTPSTLPIDPIQALVQQMGGLQSLQNRLPTNVGLPGNSTMPPPSVLSGNNVLPVTNNIPGGNSNLPPNPTLSGIGLSSNLQNDALPGLHNSIPPSNISLPNLQNLPGGGLSGNLQNSLPTKNSHTNVDALNDNNPIKKLLRQFANKSQTQQPRDTLWQQNQFVPPQMNSQWQQSQQQQPPPPPQDVPISMWDMQIPSLDSNLPLSSNDVCRSEDNVKPKESTKVKETKDNKDDKKKKEQDEKAAKKESDEKRKQEQRKQEAEKKAAEEKRKRDEERIKKELEKARKEAEEKRLRELEEKRKLKEQRKAEEEARKKAEELKKIEEQERRETKEKEELLKKQMEVVKHENQVKLAKAAPWSQSNNTHGTSLAEIQKAEREKRAEQVALLQKVKQEQETVVEKPFNTQFSWANKPMAPRQVKSLTEIQAEEQEKLSKHVAETRLAQQQKEKEVPPAISQGIWNGQNLTWANNTSHWSNAGGFWDGTISEKVSNNKTISVQKSNSICTTTVAHHQQQQQQHHQQQQQQQQQKQIQKQTIKNKVAKKEQEVVKTLNNNNNSVNDEFINWCTKSLTALKTTVDIPTFVNFLRDIESALDVREYCRDYLGDSPATHQFASQFLEKRRSFKPKINAHKDDMCSPAPAITPSSHSDFQEVKTKGKKTKKSKMLKVDSRILGFNVTASHDRINVGDRDYVDN